MSEYGFPAATDQGILAVDGNRDDLLDAVTNLVFPRLLPTKTIYVSGDNSIDKEIERRLTIFGFKPHFSGYDDLCLMTGKEVSGRSIVLVSPAMAVASTSRKGIIDGGLVRILASGLWRKLIVANESTQGSHVRNVTNLEELSRTLANHITGTTFSKSWLYELLLTLLYRRHLTTPKLLRLVSVSLWHGHYENSSNMRDALLELRRMKLVQETHGKFSCTESGRSVIEQEIPFDQININELHEWLGANPRTEVPESGQYDGWERDRDAYATEQVLDLTRTHGWTTVQWTAQRLLESNIAGTHSLWKARRLLERMTKKGLLMKLTYVRGIGRPTHIYREPTSNREQWIEERCGDCVFFARPYKRCRLWWTVNRYGASGAYSKLDEFSPISKERLRASNTRIGPKTTACEHFTPKRRDFPITKARDRCLGCGKEIDSPVATTIRCPTCGTGYKPMSDRIAVLYNYEHLFKEKYSQIVGASPPERALARYELGEGSTSEWRDLVVLYPGEAVRLGIDGMHMKREGAGIFQRYDRIYQVVDYGSLTEQQVATLEKKGVRLLRQPLQEGELPGLPLYPSSEFVTNLRALNSDLVLSKTMTESLLLSVIIGTKRVAELGGSPLKENVERQLLEYRRMKREPRLSSTRMLAYEARVNNLYWKNYKTMLRAVGFDFRSRVRDRFVREFVQSIRARARGYSPANSAINYLHQRRLVVCRRTNALKGIGWIGSEGVVHFAGRKPPIGLLLDLSDSLKLADREALLKASLNRQITRENFVSRIGRQGVRFYYPNTDGVGNLEHVGSEADGYIVNYGGIDLKLTAAYEKYIESFVNAVLGHSLEDLEPFVYSRKEELEWLKAKGIL